LRARRAAAERDGDQMLLIANGHIVVPMRPTTFLLVTALAVVVSTCATNDVDPESTTTNAVIENRNLDILFMIDDSSSMRLSQANLLANFPTFMDVLKALPGGLPNIHVAIVSSDMGAGDGSVNGCLGDGQQGIFQYTPRGTCTASPLTPGATYLSNVGGQANYTGDISAAFSCIAALGESGCGFEQPFASVLRALGADGQSAPAENQGFLRRDALLAVVMVTNEDDCSARPGVPLYDTTSNVYLSSQLGPTSNFRCSEFGVVCNGAKPPRVAPNGQVTDTVTLQNCTSSECDGLLTPVAEFVARIKALKASPATEILFAAIAGPTAPYQVIWRAPSLADSSCGLASCPWPAVAHSCVAADTSFADPGIRIAQAASAFGTNGFTSSICETNFGPALQQVASRIGSLLAAGGGSGGSGGTIPTCATTGSGGRGGGSGGGGSGGTTGAGGSIGGGAGGSTTGAGGSIAGGGTTGAGGAGAAGGTTGAGGTSAAGGTTGAGGTSSGGQTGMDASADGGPPVIRDGCDCQAGGAGANAWWLTAGLIVLIARRRSRSLGPTSRRWRWR
jgi:hypothetical protein